MPTIYLKGRVAPTSFKLTVKTAILQQITNDDGLELWISAEIVDSAITVNCRLNRFNGDRDLGLAWVAGFTIARGLVDAAAFALAVGAIVILDLWVDVNGNEAAINFADPALRGLCTAFNMNPTTVEDSTKTQFYMGLMMRDWPLSLAMNDLVQSLILPPQYGLINCGRAMETIRNDISRNDRKKGWPIMRDALQIAEDYLNYITENSKGPRHGQMHGPMGLEAKEVTRRAWMIMNRFLEYKRRGNQRLPLSELPTLET
jgi:hypothetical protein